MPCRAWPIVLGATLVGALAFCPVAFSTAALAQAPADAPAAKKPEERIDFERARGLFQKRQRGEKLTAEEQAYLERALAQRRAQQPGARADKRALFGKETTGLKPLTEFGPDDRYFDYDGGLYGEGRNEPPADHRRAAEQAIAKIQPLDAEGKPAAGGTIGLVSISMSNATQEFSMFKQLADADPAKSRQVTIVDCAQGGQAMAEWVDPRGRPWQEADRRLENAKVSPAQVQVVWVKLANKSPSGELKEHGKKLYDDTLAVLHNAQARFPNLRVAYLASRIYGGYTQGSLNPEPFAYESGFVAQWLIKDQMRGEAALNHDASRGKVQAPVLLWGAYLWADGQTPRKADGLVYQRDDFAGDGTHPSQSGRQKVARQLLEFWKQDPLARAWFTAAGRGGER